MSSQLSLERRVRFNDQDHRAIVPDSADLNFGADDFSLSAVFKADSAESLDKRRYLLNKGTNDDARYRLFLNERGRLLFETGFKDGDNFSAMSVTAKRPITAGQFHAVIARRHASGKLEIYLDGVLQAESGGGLIGSVDNIRNLWLGNSEEGGSLAGELSSVRLFNRLLSEREIQERAINPENGVVLSEDLENGCRLALNRDGLSGADSPGDYVWKDLIDFKRLASLRAEVASTHPLAAEAVDDNQELGLVERLPPELRKTAPLRELFEAIDEYWRDNIDVRVRENLKSQSVFEAAPEDINLKLEELTTYFDNYSRDNRRLSIVWKKEEIRQKNSVAALDALLRRFKIPGEYTPLYCKNSEDYGEVFYSLEEISDNKDDYFLSSHVDLRVDYEKILHNNFDKTELRKALERYFEDNIRPTHIVFRGLNFYLRKVKCVFQSVSVASGKRRICVSRLDNTAANIHEVEISLRVLSAAAQSGRISFSGMDVARHYKTAEYPFHSVSLAVQGRRTRVAEMTDSTGLS